MLVRAPAAFARAANLSTPMLDMLAGLAIQKARGKGLWKGTAADRDPAEYWAAGVEAYFDAAGAGDAPHHADRPVTTREALKGYDPALFALVDETMAYREHVDWRYRRPAHRE